MVHSATILPAKCDRIDDKLEGMNCREVDVLEVDVLVLAVLGVSMVLSLLMTGHTE